MLQPAPLTQWNSTVWSYKAVQLVGAHRKGGRARLF